MECPKSAFAIILLLILCYFLQYLLLLPCPIVVGYINAILVLLVAHLYSSTDFKPNYSRIVFQPRVSSSSWSSPCVDLSLVHDVSEVFQFSLLDGVKQFFIGTDTLKDLHLRHLVHRGYSKQSSKYPQIQMLRFSSPLLYFFVGQVSTPYSKKSYT